MLPDKSSINSTISVFDGKCSTEVISKALEVGIRSPDSSGMAGAGEK